MVVNSRRTNGFVGRHRELAELHRLLAEVADPPDDRPGRAIAIRGRRRIGKSRLVTEFASQVELPTLYYLAEGSQPEAELRRFAAAMESSSLPGARSVGSLAVPTRWGEAFATLAAALPPDSPSVVILDEMPYLAKRDDGFEGALQAAWDQALSHLPVLLVLVGSNQSEMQRLTSYGRPFYGRSVDLELRALHPRDVAELTGLSAADAIDAYTITGGFPPLVTTWPRGLSVPKYLDQAFSSSLSPLIVSGERSLSSEFRSELLASDVLRAIGTGSRTFTAISNDAAIGSASTLTRALNELAERSIIALDEPLSLKAPTYRQYRVADPYLRFWLAFCADAADYIDAGRADIPKERLARSWSAWRGRAVEPVIRQLLRERAFDDYIIPKSGAVGSWWSRNGRVELDLVGVDRPRSAKWITFVGSIKWRESAPFGEADAQALAEHRSSVPGATANTPLVAVSRTGGAAPGVTVLSPADLLETT